jgi:hypothetical protein
MIIGHLAIACIAKQTWFEKENLLLLSLAAFGPDLVDKPANMLLGLPGRGISHSLIFFFAMIAIAFLLRTWLKFSSRTLIAGIAMWGTHLVGDFLQLQVLFWPFGGHWEPSSKFHVVEKLLHFYVDRLYFAQFWMEMACVVTLFALLLSRLFLPPSPQQEILQGSELPPSDSD